LCTRGKNTTPSITYIPAVFGKKAGGDDEAGGKKKIPSAKGRTQSFGPLSEGAT